ncbi:MAG: hypothetical protein PHV78_01905 [Patescibacteria group bacterium]|nr:hypothetical protein [Patescibacteria group bacterium]MDD5121096.1 hypothetical protein [Patescibacteria group bacterium]MDD5221932.1 hypothetical protein [Patescibacteria group bacterium]MDD5395985.1 hypothetical protein [Patescibacteria group bacterium]
MNFFTRKIPIILPAFIFLLFEVLFFVPGPYFLLIGLSLLLTVSAVLLYILLKEKIRAIWPTYIQLIILILTSSLFSLFLSHGFFYHLYLIAASLFYWYILSTIFYYFYQPRLYQPYSLERSSRWIIFVTIFCFLAELSALSLFLGISPWLTIIPSWAINLWVYFYFIRATKADELKKNKWQILIVSLVLAELYLSISFLPVNFHINGLISSIFNLIILQLWLKDQGLPLPIIKNDQPL